MRIDSSGNVGIGTSSPSSDISSSSTVLEIADSNVASLALNNTTQSTKFEIASVDVSGGALSIRDNNTERMRIDSSGNVGIGTTSPTAPLHVSGSTSTVPIKIDNTGTGGDTWRIWSTNDAASDGGGKLGFYNEDTATRAMTLDSSGNVGIGTSSITSVSGYTSLEINNAVNGSILDLSQGDSMRGRLIATATTMSLETSGSIPIIFQPTGVERMRIDSSGNLLVGKTAFDSTTVGASLRPTGAAVLVSDGNDALLVNRKTSDGSIIDIRKDGTTVGSIGTSPYSSVPLYIAGGDAGLLFDGSGDTITPASSNGSIRDNAIDLGYSAGRFDDIYATNGTIQTSDRNEKQDIAELSDAEQRVAVACKGLMRKFRWKDSVAEKGDDARIHFGIIAQDLQAAFEAEGLDAGDYAMFISTTWTDEETNEEKTRMGVRYSELLAFIISAI